MSKQWLKLVRRTNVASIVALTDILPVDKLRSVMSQQLSYRDAEDCQANWVARYSVLVKTRGVIKMKGYVVDIDREFRHYK